MIKIANNLVAVFSKESAFQKHDIARFFNPFSDNITNYINSGLIGGIGGAIISSFIEDFKEKEKQNYLKAILTGGSIGAGVGLGAKGLGDAYAGEQAELARFVAGEIEKYKGRSKVK